MIEIADTQPHVDVQMAEYQRLLGYPPARYQHGWQMEGRAAELAAWAREWYALHGRPWVYAKQALRTEASDSGVCIDGIAFHSARLAQSFTRAEATSAVLVAVSAGPELEAEAARLWREEKPDEYFFLETYGSAVVEHLTTMTGARLCAWADEQKLAVLPHYSPGYPEWDISEQPSLLALLNSGAANGGASGTGAMPGAIEVLDSGALRPKKSLLAVFPLTPNLARARELSGLVPCENCSFAPCQYRRAPYLRSQPRAPLAADAKYAVNKKALARWAAERLSLEHRDDGSIDALFRYEGTTCTNEGRDMAFHYRVQLGPSADGYPIQAQRCDPAPGDTGHAFMCAYIADRDTLMSAIAREKPLLGRPLNDVVSWRRAMSPAGCYCDEVSRAHKWGLVLETIHYALAREDASRGETQES